jgi:hypothetical protein
MRMSVNTEPKIQYVLMSSKTVSPALQKIYDQAFNLWHKQWSQIFSEKGSAEELSSDQFLRQSEVSAIVIDDKVVAVFLFDWLDVSNSVHLKHSYFKPFPKEVIDGLLASKFNEVFICSHLVVDPEYRKSKSAMPVAKLTVGLCLKRFKESRFKYLISYSRNSRRTNEMGYSFGALPFMQNLTAWDEPADFMYATKKSVSEAVPGPLTETISRLWTNRIQDTPDSQLIKPINKGS